LPRLYAIFADSHFSISISAAISDFLLTPFFSDFLSLIAASFISFLFISSPIDHHATPLPDIDYAISPDFQAFAALTPAGFIIFGCGFSDSRRHTPFRMISPIFSFSMLVYCFWLCQIDILRCRRHAIFFQQRCRQDATLPSRRRHSATPPLMPLSPPRFAPYYDVAAARCQLPPHSAAALFARPLDALRR
jgi:hypothetical protein